jgi:predicted N-acetyltransferase YhbS
VTEIRPLLAVDVEAADAVAFTSLRECVRVYEHVTDLPERTPESVARSQARITHLQRTDPQGAWVAVDGDEVVGVALSLRRGPMWFLSLLAVETGLQSRGIGAQLLAASLQTAEGAGAAWILATVDPKALRRYVLAGFRPHPGFAAKGSVDRSLLPAGLGVRDGDVARDRQLVEDVVTSLRGAPYGPDIDGILGYGCGLLIAEDGLERGFCWHNARGVFTLGATSDRLAQRLLWEALGRLPAGEVTVDWLTADQQWAIDVALAARLALRPGAVSCRRTTLGPMTPYLPGGAFG